MFSKTIHKKTFLELTNQELYEILDLRATVFIIGQDIIYVDTDHKDQASMHYFIKDNDVIVAYCRVLPPGLRYVEHTVSRIATLEAYRNHGFATALMHEVMRDLPGLPLRISGQAYLKPYYEKLGFKTIKGPYIEEDIWHYEMLYEPLKKA